MQEQFTLYDRLGVLRTASGAEIAAAYRENARYYHPDLNRAPNAEAIMMMLNEAFAILGDPQRRQEYDLTLHGPRSRPSNANSASPEADAAAKARAENAERERAWAERDRKARARAEADRNFRASQSAESELVRRAREAVAKRVLDDLDRFEQERRSPGYEERQRKRQEAARELGDFWKRQPQPEYDAYGAKDGCLGMLAFAVVIPLALIIRMFLRA